jgi:hypothetical protein
LDEVFWFQPAQDGEDRDAGAISAFGKKSSMRQRLHPLTFPGLLNDD